MKAYIQFVFILLGFLMISRLAFSQTPTDSLGVKAQETSPKEYGVLQTPPAPLQRRGEQSPGMMMNKTRTIGSKIEKADVSSFLFKKTFLKKTTQRTAAFNKRLEKANTKYLKQYMKSDLKMQKKMCKTNPAMADHLFSYSADPLLYHQKDITNPALLKKKPASKETYAPLDTLKTSVAFMKLPADTGAKATAEGAERKDTEHAEKKLKNNLDSSANSAVSSLSTSSAVKPEIAKAESQTKELEQNLNYSGKLQQYFKTRRMQFKDAALKNPDLQKDYISMDKVNYYYRQQVGECKKLFAAGKSKAEKIAMNALSGNKVFRQFMQKTGKINTASKSGGQNASTGASNSGSTSATHGKGVMQTVAGVKDMMQHDLQALGPNAGSVLQEKMKPMGDAMTKLQSGNYGNTTNAGDLPDFKPNNMKTKPLIERLQFGTDFKPIPNTTTATKPTKGLSPVNSPVVSLPKGGSFAFTLGYMLTKKITIGAGVSHDLGVHASWKNIKINNLGTGLRSFVDWKIMKIIFIEGAYEENLLVVTSAGSSAPQLIISETQPTQKWVSSALLGIKLKPAVISSPTMTVLYDFLHNQHVPASPALIYRFGWAFGGTK